jgi:hypothetical protein
LDQHPPKILGENMLNKRGAFVTGAMAATLPPRHRRNRRPPGPASIRRAKFRTA